ncbi:MAG TPA: nuclear transport factor 2 family protein [Euzebyales bacterium]|nr:nuclear transport factor 2 family protein [Euzebyales bacterium]
MPDEPHQLFAQLLDAWAAAIVANDPEAIGRFAEPEWIMVGAGGIFPRQRFLESVRSGRVTHDTMSFDVHAVRLYGDVAVVVVRGRNSGTFDGTPFELDEWTSDVFVRRGDDWRCVLTHLASADDGTSAEPPL